MKRLENNSKSVRLTYREPGSYSSISTYRRYVLVKQFGKLTANLIKTQCLEVLVTYLIYLIFTFTVIITIFYHDILHISLPQQTSKLSASDNQCHLVKSMELIFQFIKWNFIISTYEKTI